MKKISEREFHYIKRLSENYVGLTAEKTIKVVSCDTGEEVFVSDKLSNMCGATYNEKTKKLLAYNTSGYAYLYQLSDGKRLLPKIYLKEPDVWPEQIIWEEDFCWYPSYRKGIYRLNTRTGEVELVVKIKGENFTHIIQDKNNMLVFTRPKTKNIYEPREKVIKYSYRIEKDGELKYQYRKQEEDYCNICFIIEDVDRRKIIVATSKEKRIEGDTLLYCSDGHLLNIPVNSRWKQGEWWYNRELQISVQDNRMIYVDEHGYLCITELYTEKIVKRERAGKYIYDILYIPAKGVFILADDGVYEVIGI
ncbi:hypothetical protein [Anaerobutyricum hallii]|uniref:hypothetical protein n=1 Tax=Anaerobutyricum hallii TaxID=39488 RepID=UPI0026EB3BDF|nr:hypothetical protein [Anaerobutyricum hallii]